jgi:alkylation response protein AidB-like acyl-CoA dehydrogenase
MNDDACVSAARRLAATAAACAAESEEQRHLAPKFVAALVDSGLPRLMAPTALGGFAAHPGTLVNVVEEIARSDGSAAWCVGIGLGSNYLAGVIPEASAREVFRELDRPAAGPFAPGGRAEITDAGYRVSGRWPYSSGCRDAAVSASGIMVFDGGQPAELNADGSPKVRLAFLTADQFTVEQTWDTVGMRGTGSDHIAATDVDLPPERVGTLWDPMWPGDAIYRLRPFDVLGPCLGAVPLGVGRAALDIITATAREQAIDPPPPGPRQPLGEDPLARMELAQAEVRLRAARLLLLDAVEGCYQHAVRGDPPPRAATAMVGLACFEAMRAGAAAVETACALAGSAAVRSGSVLDRQRRDIQTARTHVLFAPRLASGLARQVAGIDTVAYPFLPE